MSRLAVRLLSLVAVLALLLLSSCGGAARGPASGTSGVRGVAMAGGGPAPAGHMPSPWPVRNCGVLVRKGDAQGSIVARTKTDQTGRFSIDLPPGTYTLVQSAPVGATPKTVIVAPGKYVEVTLWQGVP